MAVVRPSSLSLLNTPLILFPPNPYLTSKSVEYDVGSLLEGEHYIGPTPLNENPCLCSTVMYNVMGACSTCQNATIITYVLSPSLSPFFYPVLPCIVLPFHAMPIRTFLPSVLVPALTGDRR